MRNSLNIYSREFKSYFVSPIAYIVISIFLIISGWFFFSTFFLYNQVEMRNFFELLPITFSFIIPAITMKLFSEEINTGSYELLYTMPVTEFDIILGKFFAAASFVIIMLLPTLSYGICIANLGDLDWGPVIGGYLGAVLLGAAYAAIGLFASSLTRNQVIAFIIGMTFCLFLTLIDKMLFFLPEKALSVFQYIGADFHFQNISRGIIDSRDLIYFISISFIMVHSTNLVVQKNK
ncbi:ABC transporter permease subunit [Candidatus Poribacteria bacterium]|nr:ABC transporter permease subunit [Candidatus Poribacteria bacterium]